MMVSFECENCGTPEEADKCYIVTKPDDTGLSFCSQQCLAEWIIPDGALVAR